METDLTAHGAVSALLQLPAEIRLKIYAHLFQHFEAIKIEPANPEQQTSFDGPEDDRNGDDPKSNEWLLRRPTPSGLSTQVLRVCRQVHREALPVLYGANPFDCSAREGVPLLLHNVGADNLGRVRRLVLDWEQLQEFAWSLAKPEMQSATNGLEVIEMATWRMRVLGGTSWLWRDVKAYERQICQAALDITNKHPNLRAVLQKSFHRYEHAADKHLKKGGWVNTSHRVKWRFVTERGAATAADTCEKVVDLSSELAALNVPSGKDQGQSQQPGSSDPR
jgi:hypothetical protein